MPMDFNPKEMREAGSFNKDMAPGKKYSRGSRTAPLGDLAQRDGAEHVVSSKKDGNVGNDRGANFSTDQDMGLIKNAGKSGKY